MSKPQLDEKLVELSKVIAKNAFMAEYDPDAALAAYKEQVKDQGGMAGSVALSADQFQQVCVSLGIDKEVEPEAPPAPEDGGEGEGKEDGEEDEDDDGEGDDAAEEGDGDGAEEGDGDDEDGEEGEEAAPPAPPAPKVFTKNYADIWNLVAASTGADPVEASSGAGEGEGEGGAAAAGEEQAEAPSAPVADGAELLVRLFLVTRGFGGPAMRYCLAAYDPTSSGGIDEHGLAKALALVTPNGEFESMQWTHLRRAWRKAQAWSMGGGGDGEDEEGEEEEGEEEEGAEGKKEDAPEYDGPDRRVIESLAEALLEDEYVAPCFNREIEVPKVDPPADGEEDDEEDEDD